MAQKQCTNDITFKMLPGVCALSRSLVFPDHAVQFTTNTMHGWHMASAEETIDLSRRSEDIANALPYGIITSTVGISRNGPCLSAKDWDAVSPDEQNAVLDEFFKLPEEERIWYRSGDGPAFVSTEIISHRGVSYSVLSVNAGKGANNTGRVLWVGNTYEDVPAQETTSVARRGSHDAIA